LSPAAKTPREPRLSVCDLARCEGRCCYDGAYLLRGEEEFLKELVAKVPALRKTLPSQFIVDGWWEGQFYGRKTATRPAVYRSADFPAHFTSTRCVFGDDNGYCRLETFARGRGQHPWTFKPTICWMFPLHEKNGRPAPPPLRKQDDPYRTKKYPGYATFLPCGRNDPQGKPWREALAKEIDYRKQAKRLPVLGSAGHSVDELLAAGEGK
jgi:hypothetical protein